MNRMIPILKDIMAAKKIISVRAVNEILFEYAIYKMTFHFSIPAGHGPFFPRMICIFCC